MVDCLALTKFPSPHTLCIHARDGNRIEAIYIDESPIERSLSPPLIDFAKGGR